jgi:hypothetical protein
MSQLVCGMVRQAAKGLGLRLEMRALKRIAQPDEIANAVAFSPRTPRALIGIRTGNQRAL